MKAVTVAAPKPPPAPLQPLDYKSCLLVGSVTSSTKQEALCSEKQPLWEQREGEEGCGGCGGMGGQQEQRRRRREKKKKMWVKVSADTDH